MILHLNFCSNSPMHPLLKLLYMSNQNTLSRCMLCNVSFSSSYRLVVNQRAEPTETFATVETAYNLFLRWFVLYYFSTAFPSPISKEEAAKFELTLIIETSRKRFVIHKLPLPSLMCLL